jgi:hypothetical protein
MEVVQVVKHLFLEIDEHVELMHQLFSHFLQQLNDYKNIKIFSQK